MRRVAILLWSLVLSICCCQPVLAQNRVALVIGNSAYQTAPALANPVNDATDVAVSLRRLGFSVRLLTNATFEDMRKGLRDFSAEAQQADIATVYFAGHGIEIRDENWLVPVDAHLRMDVDASHEAISLGSIVPIVSNSKKLGLVILDACRDNPFVASLQSTSGRSLGYRGLAPVDPPGSTLIVFSAKHGTSAGDGVGRNSPFTAALLRNIETPGLEINYLFRSVHDDVVSATDQRQEPYVYGSLSKDPIYLAPSVTTPAPQPADTSSAAQAWNEAKDTRDPAVLRAFVSHFDGSFYADLAKSRLNDLTKLASADAKSAAVASAATSGAAASGNAAASSKPQNLSKEDLSKPDVSNKSQLPQASTGSSPDKPAAKADVASPVGARANGVQASDLIGEWQWTARCGLLGNWNGTLKVTSASNGSFSGIISDPLHGTQRISDGQFSGSGFSFSRSLPLETQYAHGTIRRADSGFRISGSFTNKLMGCPVSGGKA